MAFPTKLLNEGEHVVVSTRTHVKALILPCLSLVVVLALALFLAGPLLRWLTTTYTFTNRRFIKRSGFIAKEGRTIPLNRISGVDFEIGVIDRIFGCGTLVVSDASTDGSVELHDIPRVEQVQLQVSNELHRLAGGDRRDDGA